MNKYRIFFTDGNMIETTAINETEARYKAAMQYAGRQIRSVYWLGV